MARQVAPRLAGGAAIVVSLRIARVQFQSLIEVGKRPGQVTLAVA